MADIVGRINGLRLAAQHDFIDHIGMGPLARDAQQAADQGIILRKVCELALNPGMNIQDGMLTTHSERMFCAPEAEFLREYLLGPVATAALQQPGTGWPAEDTAWTATLARHCKASWNEYRGWFAAQEV